MKSDAELAADLADVIAIHRTWLAIRYSREAPGERSQHEKCLRVATEAHERLMRTLQDETEPVGAPWWMRD